MIHKIKISIALGYISIFLNFFIYNNLYAQPPQGAMPANGTISGQVVEAEGGDAIEYAAVALIRLRDSSVVAGGLTDANGKFSFDQLAYGKYRLKIDFIGYKSYINENILLRPNQTNVRLDKIELAENNSDTRTQTETVEIEAEKSMMQIGPEKKIFNVEKSIVSQGGTAADVLEQVPSVTIDQDGKASLRGAGNVIILIDGKPSMLTGGDRGAVLDQIPANLIEKVEVITNPSARYDPDGMAGIINIVLKKNRKPGYFGSANVNVGTNNKYNTGVNFSYGNSKFNLTALYGFRYNEMWRRTMSYRETFPTDTFFVFDQNGRADMIHRNHNAGLELDYRFNNKNRITLNGDISHRSHPRSGVTYYRYLDESKVLTGSSERYTNETDDGLGLDAGLRYEKIFTTNEHKLNFAATYSGNKGDNGMLAEQIGRMISENSDKLRQTNPTHSQLGLVQLDYIQPLKNKMRLEAGLKSTFRIIDNDFQADIYQLATNEWQNDINRTNHFVFNEQIYAGYGILAGEINKFSYQAGLRLEEALTRSEQLTQTATYTYNYFSFFPSFHLSYRLTDFQFLQASFSRRINRPDTRALNPFTDYSDPLNLHRGNPLLRPEYINSFDLQFNRITQKYTFSASVYYRLTTDQIIRYRYVTPEGPSIMTQENLTNGHSYGVEGVLMNKWTKWWNTTLSINIFGIELNDGALTGGIVRRGINGTGKFISNFSIAKKVDIQVAYNYRSPNTIAQGEMKAIHALDAAIKVNVLKGKGTITANVSDIFDTRRFAVETLGTTFSQESEWKRETRIGYIGFAYNFGNMNPSKSNQQKKRERGDDGGGMEGM